MGKYRKVDPRIWNDAKFREVSDDGKLVVFFLLTHPHMTSLGAMRHSIPGMAAELGWSAEGFREAFHEAVEKGIAKHDERACMVWLPKFLRYNPPESPNVVKAWRAAADSLPECALYSEMFQEVRAFTEGMGKGFREAFAHAFPDPSLNPEPEPEPEPEQEREGASPTAPPAPERSQRNGKQKGQGIRLPDDFSLTEERLQYATEQGLSAVEAGNEFNKFRDYWLAQPGSKGRKADWDATWRNWVRRAVETRATRGGGYRGGGMAGTARRVGERLRAAEQARQSEGAGNG